MPWRSRAGHRSILKEITLVVVFEIRDDLSEIVRAGARTAASKASPAEAEMIQTGQDVLELRVGCRGNQQHGSRRNCWSEQFQVMKAFFCPFALGLMRRVVIVSAGLLMVPMMGMQVGKGNCIEAGNVSG